MKPLIGYGLICCLTLASTLASQAQESTAKSKAMPAEGHAVKAKPAASSPAKQYSDVLKAYQKAQSEFTNAYRAAKTDTDRSKIRQTKEPDLQAYADKMLKIAQAAPKDPVAVEALMWVSLHGSSLMSEQAMKILAADHIEDPRISSLCVWMVYIDLPQSEAFLREVLAHNPGREAQAEACIALGRRLKLKAEQANSVEATESLNKEARELARACDQGICQR